MHERHSRRRNVEQSVALRRNFPQPAPNKNDEITVLNALNKLRIGVQSQIAGITGVEGIE